MLIIDVTLRLF